MAAPHESIWGSINTCFEIGIDIYQIFCTSQNGENKSGIMLPVDRAKELLSDEALSLITEKDGFAYIENNATLKEIRSGLSIIKDEQSRFCIAVHSTLAERDLTLNAQQFGNKIGDFYYYGITDCAIPIYELARKYPEISDIVLNRESLEQTIISKAPDYADYWNANHAKPGEEIKPNGSIPMMFLQEHYDYEAASTRCAAADFIHTENTNEHDAISGFEQFDEEWELER